MCCKIDNIVAQWRNIVLTTNLTLNVLLLCEVKQPTLEFESVAYVYFSKITSGKSQLTPEAQ